MRASQEGVVFGGNVLEAEVDGGGALINDALNLLLGESGSDRIALNDDVDGCTVVLLKRASLLLLGNLYAGAGTLADALDGGTLAADDVSAD